MDSAYIAPEVLQRKNYTQQADVYSFGMVLYELFSGKRAFHDHIHRKHRHLLDPLIESGDRPDPEDLPKHIRSLVQRCWSENPDARPTSQEVCEELEQLHKEYVQSSQERESLLEELIELEDLVRHN